MALFEKKWYLYIAWGSTIAGIVVMAVFFYRLQSQFSLARTNMLMSETGQTGDFIGGVVGTIWAFTGMVLFYVSIQIQREDLLLQKKQWGIQRVEDIYFRLIDNYFKIDFHQNSHTRGWNTSYLAISISNRLSELSDQEDYKTVIKSFVFDKNTDNTYERLYKSLFFIIKYLYDSNIDTSDLLKHLTWTLPQEEKELLFYYLVAHPTDLKSLGNKYINSELVPYLSNVIANIVQKMESSCSKSI